MIIMSSESKSDKSSYRSERILGKSKRYANMQQSWHMPGALTATPPKKTPPAERQLLRPWLIKQINKGKKPVLVKLCQSAGQDWCKMKMSDVTCYYARHFVRWLQSHMFLPPTVYLFGIFAKNCLHVKFIDIFLHLGSECEPRTYQTCFSQ